MTKTDREKKIDEKIKEKSMSDEEQLALLKDQTSNEFGQLGRNGIGFAASNEAGQLAGDCIGFNMNGEHPKSKSIFHV